MNPVYLRGFIYVTLAALGPVTGYFTVLAKDILDGKHPIYHWVIWTLIVLQSIGAGLLALRMFVDGSYERSKQPAPILEASQTTQPKAPNETPKGSS